MSLACSHVRIAGGLDTKPRLPLLQTSRDSTPAGTPRGTPRHSPAPENTSSSASTGSSSDLEPSPPHVHAQPQSLGERQSRAPRRPHQGSSSSVARSGSAGRPRVKLPRAPPRPQSAPPTKHRSRFGSASGPSGGGERQSSPPPSARTASKSGRQTPVQRELATDVLSQGQWYRVPEKTIRLDFWSKIGLDTGVPTRPTGHGGLSMMRTNSMPAYSPREALLTPDGSRSSFFSPLSATEDSFSAAEGDFSDSENPHGKRERYAGPLFSRAGSLEPTNISASSSNGDLAALDRMGLINLASSPHGTPKRRSISLRPSAPTSPRLGHSPLSPATSPPAAPVADPITPKLSPEQTLIADNDAHAAKRMRSTSPASPPTSPSLTHASPAAAIPVGPTSISGPSSPTAGVQHPSPLMHHNIAAQSIPRSSSPLRFSSTAIDKLAHAPLPKSSLSSPALSHTLPLTPLADSAMDVEEPPTTPVTEEGKPTLPSPGKPSVAA